MTELLKLLREVVGVRPLVPIILVALTALLFKTLRDYPIRELIYDRWFLATSLAIISAFLVYLILTSGVAERTPSGRFGIYLARIENDPSRAIQRRLSEALKANIGMNPLPNAPRVDVRDYDRQLSDETVKEIDKAAPSLNAAIVIWGTAIDEKTFYPRTWIEKGGVTRDSKPIDVTSLEDLAIYSTTISSHLSQLAAAREVAAAESEISASQLRSDVQALRAELAEMRTSIRSATIVTSTDRGTRIAAVLVGVAKYKDFPLSGPVNDVEAMDQALMARNPKSTITKLIDGAADVNAIRGAIDKAISLLTPEESLFLFFSGHTGVAGNGSSAFYTADLENPILLGALFREVLQRHPKTILVVDGGFATREFEAAMLPKAAILSADPSGEGLATELLDKDGKYRGRFTSAFVEALRGAATGLPVAIPQLFAEMAGTLKSRKVLPNPAIVVGSEPPSL